MAWLSDKVKVVTRLKNEEMNKANMRHREAVAKLEQQKAELRERAKAHRTEYKERVSGVAAKNEALELLCSVSELETKKLGRELSSEQLRVAAFGQKETLLAERVHKMEFENELLSETLETKHQESDELCTEMDNLRSDLAAKSAQLDEVNDRFKKWKELDREFRRKTKAKLAG